MCECNTHTEPVAEDAGDVDDAEEEVEVTVAPMAKSPLTANC